MQRGQIAFSNESQSLKMLENCLVVQIRTLRLLIHERTLETLFLIA